ncbi:hypothetical protein B0H14DRAFT_1098046 [Mycena olivaceomarginata]|nr:hypothetical protein B0H14DRAFT_1098046 [Mycena olivaceomarginata]
MHAAISWYSAILTAARLTNTGMSSSNIKCTLLFSWYSAILTAARLTNTGMSYFYLLLSQLYSLACHPYRFHQHSSHMEANTSAGPA